MLVILLSFQHKEYKIRKFKNIRKYSEALILLDSKDPSRGIIYLNQLLNSKMKS